MASGVINLLKPPGMTSRQAVSRVAHLTGEKAGHAGTLDPQACGVLPILLGKATRLFDFVAGERKQYLAEICFGVETDTQDAEGSVLFAGGRLPLQEDVVHTLTAFCGEGQQTPPAYSAKKVDGVRAHRLARSGDMPVLTPQAITIHAIDYITQSAPDRHLIRVFCSKGTYIRTLCRDIGAALGTYAHMSFLLREATGGFAVESAVTLEALEAAITQEAPKDTWLIPMDTVLESVPAFHVSPGWETACRNGVVLPITAGTPPPDGCTQVCVYSGAMLVGLGTIKADSVRVTTWLMESEET